MAATIDSMDLFGTDLAHPRPRPRFAAPIPPPPQAIDRLPRSMPATIDLEAPTWPGIQLAPAVVEIADDIVLPPPDAIVVATEEPPVRRAEPVLHLEPPPVRVVAARPVPRAFFEGEFEEVEDSFFEEEAPFLDERPAGLPWWALAVPASAALGMVSMVVTALVLLSAWT